MKNELLGDSLSRACRFYLHFAEEIYTNQPSMQAEKVIKDLIETHPVMLFMKGSPQQPQCGFSARVVQILDFLKVTYHSFDVLTDNTVREGIKSYSNWPTIPQLYVKKELVGGCDIVQELFQKGELEGLFKDS